MKESWTKEELTANKDKEKDEKKKTDGLNMTEQRLKNDGLTGRKRTCKVDEK